VRKAGDKGAELTGGRGGVDHARKAALWWVGAPGPTEEERVMLVRCGDGEPVVETGGEAVASLPADGEVSGADKMHREGPFYSCVGGGWMGWTGRLGLGS
jgi:hypothetical protein